VVYSAVACDGHAQSSSWQRTGLCFVMFRDYLSLVLLSLPAFSPLPALAQDEIDFSRDIRPILSDACFQCHGPDERSREAGLRLDQSDSAFGVLDSGQRAIVPSEANASELVRRITTEDASERMPPQDFTKSLRAANCLLARRLAESGARFVQLFDRDWDHHRSLKSHMPRKARETDQPTAGLIMDLKQRGLWNLHTFIPAPSPPPIDYKKNVRKQQAGVRGQKWKS
jgi:hypothetical protein